MKVRAHGWVFAAAAFTAVVAGPRAARAHGAFPSPMALFTSPAAPSSVVVATNVGLFRSDDAGQTWRWQCEDAVAGTTSSYGVAADLQTTYALTETSVAASRAEECAFAPLASGPALPFGIIPDAALPSRVWLLESESSLASFDGAGGRRSRLTLPPASRLVSAYGAGAVVLATGVADSTPGVLFDSSDGGETWRQRALPPSVQSFGPMVLAVGPEPGLILLRLIGVDGDRIARSTDGGATFQTSAELPGFMRGFAQDEHGNLYVGLDDVSTGRLVVLDADLETTETLPLAFVPRGVAHHGGKLYILTNTFDPPGPLLASDDGGHTFQSALDTKRVTVAPACAATTTCQSACEGLVNFGLLAAGACPWPSHQPPTVTPQPPPAPTASGCQLAPRGPSPEPLSLTIAALALSWLRSTAPAVRRRSLPRYRKEPGRNEMRIHPPPPSAQGAQVQNPFTQRDLWHPRQSWPETHGPQPAKSPEGHESTGHAAAARFPEGHTKASPSHVAATDSRSFGSPQLSTQAVNPAEREHVTERTA